MFLIFVLLPLGIEATEWTSLRNGPEGRASLAYEDPRPLAEWYYTYKTTLRYRPGLAVWSSPALAVVDDRPLAFIGGHTQTLLALDLLDRRVRWLKITNGEIGSAPAVGTVSGRSIVYFGSADRSVYALDALTGDKVWTRELIPPSPTQGISTLSSPLLHAGRIYLTCFNYDKSLSHNRQQAWLVCLDQATGQEYWRMEITPGFVSSPVGFTLNRVFHIVIAARKGFVQCFRLEHGRPRRLWSYQMPHEVFGSPVIEADTENPYLFLGSKFGNLVALDAQTGTKQWQRMAGNWIDNSACIGSVDGRNVVFAGSHDYKLYAFDCRTGEVRWSRPLGGEIYSAPVFFHLQGEPMVAAACLDDRVYAVSARTGEFYAAFFAGEPIWDKAPKGETLMGSPVVLEAGPHSLLLHGSYAGTICVFPLQRDSRFRDTARSFTALWLSLPIVLIIFIAIVLPILLKLPDRKN